MILLLSLMFVLTSCGKRDNTLPNQEDIKPSQSPNDVYEETPPIEPAEKEHIELPRPLTYDNKDKFIEIIQSEGEQYSEVENTKKLFNWSYYDGALLISCNGELKFKNENNIYNIPWESIKGEIKEIIVDNGCTGFNESSTDNGFSELTNLVTILLPDGITNTPNLRRCTSIEYVAIPDTVTTLGRFTECKSLKEISIPPLVSLIQKSTFSDCTNLESIKLNDGLKSIEESAFYNCEGLKSITIPYTIEKISRNSFKNCNNIIEIINYSPNYIVDNGVLMEVISSELLDAFKNEIENGNKNYTLDKAIIKAESTINGEYTIPLGYSIIADTAFKNCTELTFLNFNKHKTKIIGNEAFYGCTNLEGISKLEGDVYTRAFAYCTSLKEIPTVDNGSGHDVTFKSIGDGEQFRGCTGLNEIAFSRDSWSKNNLSANSFIDTEKDIYIEYAGHPAYKYGMYSNITEEVISSLKGYYTGNLYVKEVKTGEIEQVG